MEISPGSPATQQTSQVGSQMSARIYVSMAIKLLEQSLPSLEADDKRAVLSALNLMVRHFGDLTEKNLVPAEIAALARKFQTQTQTPAAPEFQTQ